MTTAHRISNLAGVVLPLLAVAAAIVLLWNTLVDWSDLALLAVMYVATGLGITVGFHRMLTHRSFATYKPVQYAWAILGSVAVQGPVTTWVADHRKHHAFTDQDGDPHSPHGHGSGFKGAVKGLWYAHMGWLFDRQGQAAYDRYARDLVEDRGFRIINALFPLWVTLGIALPAALGWWIDGSVAGAVTGALWGGAVPHLPAAPRHMVDQLRLPLLRLPPLRRGRPLDERVLAGPAVLRGVLAPQPPRVPSLGRPRAALVGGRPHGLGDPRHEGDAA